jgi:hypothetical protein
LACLRTPPGSDWHVGFIHNLSLSNKVHTPTSQVTQVVLFCINVSHTCLLSAFYLFSCTTLQVLCRSNKHARSWILSNYQTNQTAILVVPVNTAGSRVRVLHALPCPLFPVPLTYGSIILSRKAHSDRAVSCLFSAFIFNVGGAVFVILP